MLYEHEEGRNYLEELREAVSNISDESNRKKFVYAARSYVELIRQHIWKEDNVLFKMAEQVLTENDDNKLAENFDHYEEEKIGKEVHDKYHNLIHELEAYFVKA
ncbi:MAG: hemerythrin domain-containing protein [bacterium]